jgi:hypothetical protein
VVVAGDAEVAVTTTSQGHRSVKQQEIGPTRRAEGRLQ